MGQVLRLALAFQKWCYDGAYRARVGRTVGVAASLAVDGADVQARSAADTVQRLLELRSEQLGAAVVHEDEVQFFGPVELARLRGVP